MKSDSRGSEGTFFSELEPGDGEGHLRHMEYWFGLLGLSGILAGAIVYVNAATAGARGISISTLLVVLFCLLMGSATLLFSLMSIRRRRIAARG